MKLSLIKDEQIKTGAVMDDRCDYTVMGYRCVGLKGHPEFWHTMRNENGTPWKSRINRGGDYCG